MIAQGLQKPYKYTGEATKYSDWVNTCLAWLETVLPETAKDLEELKRRKTTDVTLTNLHV